MIDVRIIADPSWITGRLAMALQKYNPRFRMRLLDGLGEVDRDPARLNHFLLWTLWRREYGERFLLSLHHLDETHSGYNLEKAKMVIDLAAAIVVPCRQTLTFLCEKMGVDSRKVFHIPYGIPLEEYSAGKSLRREIGIPADRFVIGHFSTLHQRKGFDFLLEAFRQGCQSNPHWFLLLITGKSDGASESIQQQALAFASQHSNSCRILTLDQVAAYCWRDLYHTIDAYCSPAWLEGGPIPVLEAMAAGVPVAATLTGMAADFYDGKNLVAIRPGDAADIRAGLARVEQEATMLSLRGRLTVKRFHEEAFARAYGELYLDLFPTAGKKPATVKTEPAVSRDSRNGIIVIARLDKQLSAKSRRNYVRGFYTLLMHLQANGFSQVICALADEEESQPLQRVCRQLHLPFIQCCKDDLTRRIVEAGSHFPADCAVLRLNADGLVYPADLLRSCLAEHWRHDADFTQVGGLPAKMLLEIYSAKAMAFLRDLQGYDAIGERPANLLLGRREFRTHWIFTNLALEFPYLQDDLFDYEEAESAKKIAGIWAEGGDTHDIFARLNRWRGQEESVVLSRAKKVSNPTKKKLINILYINQVSIMGGAEQSLFLLLKHIDRRRFRPVFLGAEQGELTKKLISIGVTTYNENLSALQNFHSFRFYRVWSNLNRLLKKESIDLIHANSFPDSFFSAFLGNALAIPAISHQRDFIKQGQEKLADNLLKNDFVLAVSESIRRNILDNTCLAQDRVLTLFNGCEIPAQKALPPGKKYALRKELGLEKDTLVLAYVGMIYPWKGVAFFLKAAAPLLSRYPSLHILVVGEAKVNRAHYGYYRDLQDWSLHAGLTDRIHFTGFIADHFRVFPAIDLLCHPPLEPDPLPRVVIEAMSFGIPVVAARSGGIPEEIADEELLFSPNHKEELAAKLVRLLDAESLRRSKGEALRKRAKKYFGIERHTRWLERFYERLCREYQIRK